MRIVVKFLADVSPWRDACSVLSRFLVPMSVLLVCWFGVAVAEEPPKQPNPADVPSPNAPKPNAPTDAANPNAPGDAPKPNAPTDTPNPSAPADAPSAPADAPKPNAPADAPNPNAPADAPNAPTDTPTTNAPPTNAPPAMGPTVVTGRVTDVLGRPVPNARVYVLPRRGQPHQTKTGKDGRYSVQVGTLGTHGVVIAIDRAHTFRTVLVRQGMTNTMDVEVELDIEGGEVIKIEDRKRPQPAVKAKPTKDPRVSLPYSEEAVERDAWARAWLLLDVDEQGIVTRMKLLKRPGFDLDKICIEEAFKLRFDPARDAAGRPMKTYMLWTFEWPSWGWLIQGNGVAVRRPADSNAMHSLAANITVTGTEGAGNAKIGGPWARPSAAATAFEGALDRVPCAGSGPLNLDLRNRAYRDCSQPDMSVAESLPWITRETADTAIAELANPNLMLVTDDTPKGSPIPGYVLAGVTAGLAITTVISFLQFDKYQQRVEDSAWQATIDPDAYRATAQSRSRWGKLTLGFTAATILSGGVTLLVWHRSQSRSSFSVQPTSSGSGGAALFTTSF